MELPTLDPGGPTFVAGRARVPAAPRPHRFVRRPPRGPRRPVRFTGRRRSTPDAGLAEVTARTVAATAPLLTAAGLIPLAPAHSGAFEGFGLPLAFVAVGAVLVLFSIGYLGLRHRSGRRGPPWADVSAELGRPAGVAVAWLWVAAGNLALFGLYGLVGAVLVPWADRAGLGLPWWSLSGAACLGVALAPVLVPARPAWIGVYSLALLAAQVSVLVGLDVALLLHPATTGPAASLVPGPLIVAVVAFLGFDAALGWTGRARHGDRTVAVATYLALGVVGGLAVLSAWAVQVAAGPGFAAAHGADTVFVLAGRAVGSTAADLGRAVFGLTAITAAVRLQAGLARHSYVLGRERGLPAAFGRTTRRGGSPAGAAYAQAALAAAGLTVATVVHLDPARDVYFWASTAGAYGAVLVLAATALAVAVASARLARPGWWHRWGAPGLALLALTAMAVAGGPNWVHIGQFGVVPAAYAAVAVFGIGWAVRLRRRAPADYQGLASGELWPVPPLRLNARPGPASMRSPAPSSASPTGAGAG